MAELTPQQISTNYLALSADAAADRGDWVRCDALNFEYQRRVHLGEGGRARYHYSTPTHHVYRVLTGVSPTWHFDYRAELHFPRRSMGPVPPRYVTGRPLWGSSASQLEQAA